MEENENQEFTLERIEEFVDNMTLNAIEGLTDCIKKGDKSSYEFEFFVRSVRMGLDYYEKLG